MLNLTYSLFIAGPVFFRTRGQLAVENLALRRHFGVLKRSVKRPGLEAISTYRGLDEAAFRSRHA